MLNDEINCTATYCIKFKYNHSTKLDVRYIVERIINNYYVKSYYELVEEIRNDIR